MTNEEFSNNFTVLLNTYSVRPPFGSQNSPQEVALDEYEKSVYLTRAQEEIVLGLYKGTLGKSFEASEEIRRYLEALVKTRVYTKDEAVKKENTLTDKSYCFELDNSVAFITLEQVIYEDDKEKPCSKDGVIAKVYPVTQDEYARIRNNPFRGVTDYKVLRLDYGNSVLELISKYDIKEYLIRYISKPEPIILEDLPNGLTINGESEKTECLLHSLLHQAILQKAVELALVGRRITTNVNN